MHFRQFYLGCLAHASYLIGGGGEAAVVDPQRDIEQYLDDARENSLVIKHVIETHLHADFVSGHRELAARTGAKVYFGRRAPAKFEFVPVHDGDQIRMGAVRLEFLETPGHTPESISIVVFDEEKSSGTPDSVLTGDALFIGDVGRPDLLGARMPAVQLAGMLYDSLHEKLLKLPDDVKVFPAHGAGSMCGRNISSERMSTIGHERRFNYALQPMPRADFIKMMTTDLPEAPAYFSRDAQINLEGPALLEDLPAPRALSPEEVLALQKTGCLVLDVRTAQAYGAAHIPGSLQIGLSGQFASWAGSLIKLETAIVLITEDEASVREARTRLARVGLENVVGYLSGGVLSWSDAGLPLRHTEQISVEELRRRLDEKSYDILFDVRGPGEWQAGHVPEATHSPLNHFEERLSSVNRDSRIAVVCAGGFRSAIGASILERCGFLHISDVVGGMNAWNNAKLAVVA